MNQSLKKGEAMITRQKERREDILILTIGFEVNIEFAEFRA